MPDFHTKWLLDAKVAVYKEKYKQNMHQQAGTTPLSVVSFNGANTHSQYYHSVAQQKPGEQKHSPIINDCKCSALSSGKHHNKPKIDNNIVIELSSDKELLNTVSNKTVWVLVTFTKIVLLC